jgi:hypothetical protein
MRVVIKTVSKLPGLIRLGSCGGDAELSPCGEPLFHRTHAGTRRLRTLFTILANCRLKFWKTRYSINVQLLHVC